MWRNRWLRGCAVLLLAASTAPGYYHFLQYSNRSGVTVLIPKKFDLASVPNRTVTFVVTDAALAQVTPPEQTPSVLNAVREATRVWNSVSTSDLRVAFGGIAAVDLAQTTPGADVGFEEMDPLTFGYGGPTVTAGAVISGSTGPFIPISHSVVRLNRDLTAWKSPSAQEGFFLSVVHEMGHALGLQHTFTSSAMSTQLTRATTLARPIDADDIAGLTVLYGSLAQFGSITGRVTFQGSNQGVNMASVVAIRNDGSAVSALTDTDGNYKIDGIPGGRYTMYVQPLPPVVSGRPPGDIVLPLDINGNPVQPDVLFDTVFWPGTRDPSQAAYFNVSAGGTVDSVSFAVNRRGSASLPYVVTYSYFGNTAVQPGVLSNGGTLVAYGPGLAAGNRAADGLGFSFLGNLPQVVPGSVRAYADVFLALDLTPTSFFAASGPRHLVVSLPNDLHVRPSALNIVQASAPSITSATPGQENGARVVALAGVELRPDTRFYFDGVRANTLRFDDTNRPVVQVPSGVSGYRATVVAFNSDGQNSMFVQAGAAPAYTYDPTDIGSVTLNPPALRAGVESMVEITGAGTSFADGTTSVGFGTTDVQVRRLWVLSPNRILANVWVSPDAPAAATTVTVLTGFQVISSPLAFQIQPYQPQALVISSQVTNLGPGQSVPYPGATVALGGTNLANATVTINDRTVTVVSSSSREIRFQLPSDLSPGLAVLRVTSGSDSVAVVVQISLPPQEIRAITALGGQPIDDSSPARPGDILRMVVVGLVDGSSSVAASRLAVRVAGLDQQLIAVSSDGGGTYVIQFQLSGAAATSSPAPVTVAYDGRTSVAIPLAVRVN